MAFTPTQQRILKVLSDGAMHPKSDLQACLNDELSTGLGVHLTLIRRLLRPVGEEIICREEQGVSYFQHVRLVAKSSEE